MYISVFNLIIVKSSIFLFNTLKSIFELNVENIDTFSKYLIDNIKEYEIIFIENKDYSTSNEVHQTSSDKL